MWAEAVATDRSVAVVTKYPEAGWIVVVVKPLVDALRSDRFTMSLSVAMDMIYRKEFQTSYRAASARRGISSVLFQCSYSVGSVPLFEVGFVFKVIVPAFSPKSASSPCSVLPGTGNTVGGISVVRTFTVPKEFMIPPFTASIAPLEEGCGLLYLRGSHARSSVKDARGEKPHPARTGRGFVNYTNAS
jgi:hypothetical protein